MNQNCSFARKPPFFVANLLASLISLLYAPASPAQANVIGRSHTTPPTMHVNALHVGLRPNRNMLALSGSGTVASPSLTDTLVTDFSAGTGTNTYVSQIADGEIIQSPTVGTEFSGTTLPSGWTANNWSSGG